MFAILGKRTSNRLTMLRLLQLLLICSACLFLPTVEFRTVHVGLVLLFGCRAQSKRTISAILSYSPGNKYNNSQYKQLGYLIK